MGVEIAVCVTVLMSACLSIYFLCYVVCVAHLFMFSLFVFMRFKGVFVVFHVFKLAVCVFLLFNSCFCVLML